MMEEQTKSPVENQQVLEFIRVAWEYIVYLEREEKNTLQETMTLVQKLGPLLYLKAQLIPEIEPEFPEALEHFVTEEEWEKLFNTLREEFGKDDIFWYIDPDENADYDPIKASFAEHLTDLYQDLKDFILLYQKNSLALRENAVYDIARLFKYRWGPALLRMLSYIHQNIYPITPDDPYIGILD